MYFSPKGVARLFGVALAIGFVAFAIAATRAHGGLLIPSICGGVAILATIAAIWVGLKLILIRREGSFDKPR